MSKYSLAYLLILFVFGWGIYATIQAGKRLDKLGDLRRADPGGDARQTRRQHDHGAVDRHGLA
jgi:hypothetical protein